MRQVARIKIPDIIVICVIAECGKYVDNPEKYVHESTVPSRSCHDIIQDEEINISDA